MGQDFRKDCMHTMQHRLDISGDIIYGLHNLNIIFELDIIIYVFIFLSIQKYLSIYQLSLPIANIEYRISSLYAFSVLSPDLHFLQRQKYSGISKTSKFCLLNYTFLPTMFSKAGFWSDVSFATIIPPL